LPLCIVAGAVALVLRYRRGSYEVRHQIRWLIVAVSFVVVGTGANEVLAVFGIKITLLQDLVLMGQALVPVAAAIAVLKYRLYDIDVVISRTLAYGTLAVSITAV